MKQLTFQYLALDVHQATTVASVREEKGTVVMRATVPTEARALLQLVKSAGPRVHVAFEEGTQAQWLHDLPPRTGYSPQRQDVPPLTSARSFRRHE